jgi:hypothetical protein
VGAPPVRYLRSGRDGQLRPSGVEPAPHVQPAASSAATPGACPAAAPVAAAPAAGRQACAAEADGRAASPGAATTTATAIGHPLRVGCSHNRDSPSASGRDARAYRRSAPPGSPVGAAERRYPPVRAAASWHVPRLARQGAGREPACADDLQQGDPDASAEWARDLRRGRPPAHGDARSAREPVGVVVARVAARRALSGTALLAASRLVAMNEGTRSHGVPTDRERRFDAGVRHGKAIAARLVQSDEPRSGEELVSS